MASNQTPNFGLSQWEADDPVLRADFNADNQKIDAALRTLALRNCRIYYDLYTGNNTPSRTFEFPGKPILVWVTNGNHWIWCTYGLSKGFNNTDCLTEITWTDTSMTAKCITNFSGCCNWINNTYYLVALLMV